MSKKSKVMVQHQQVQSTNILRNGTKNVALVLSHDNFAIKENAEKTIKKIKTRETLDNFRNLRN